MAIGSANLVVVDVAIIGGGPTGLFAGLLLHRLGVSVCILDGKPSSLELGRADALNARTQQYFEIANLLDDLLSLGIKCNTSSTFSDGEFKSRQNAWWVNLEHTLHKNFLMIGQPVIEEILSSRLEGLVRYGEQVISISEDETSVEVITESGQIVRSKYALGADGARSMVRNAMGVTFKGTKPEMLWAVLDTFIDTNFPTCSEIITFQLDGQSRVSWIPRERGLCRFYVLLDGEVTQERAEESIKKHLAPYRVEFKQTEWYSTFEVKERIASSFVSKEGEGRIILGGDAAHVHSVNGGQGLNTGIADAFNLAWRLATVIKKVNLRDGAANAIIQSYDIERRKTAQGVIDVAAALVRDTVRTAKQYVGTIEKNAGYITGMGVSYDGMSSPLVKESQHGFWKAGSRCPDFLLRASNGEDRWLYSEITYGKFVILCVGKIKVVEIGHADDMVVYKILPVQDLQHGLANDTHTESGFGSEKNRDNKRFGADWVSEDDSFVVVVRPDLYIGCVSQVVTDCTQYLDQLYDRSLTP